MCSISERGFRLCWMNGQEIKPTTIYSLGKMNESMNFDCNPSISRRDFCIFNKCQSRGGALGKVRGSNMETMNVCTKFCAIPCSTYSHLTG